MYVSFGVPVFDSWDVCYLGVPVFFLSQVTYMYTMYVMLWGCKYKQSICAWLLPFLKNHIYFVLTGIPLYFKSSRYMHTQKRQNYKQLWPRFHTSSRLLLLYRLCIDILFDNLMGYKWDTNRMVTCLRISKLKDLTKANKAKYGQPSKRLKIIFGSCLTSNIRQIVVYRSASSPQKLHATKLSK